MIYAAMLAGTAMGSLEDPLVWLIILIGTAAGLTRQNIGVAIIGAFGVLVLRQVISAMNREALGLQPDQLLLAGTAGAIIWMAAYGLGRAIRHTHDKP